MTRPYRPPTPASDLATWTHHELRDEIERLQVERDKYREYWQSVLQDADDVHGKNCELEDEIERLRAALKSIDAQSIASTEAAYVAVPARTIADAVALANGE
jgi:uncharacterized small protein (DUF1192 family)